MLTPERHRKILERLQESEIVKIHELVEATASSESTIRRDLSQLEKEKKLKRVHGGASLLEQKGVELSISEKSTKNLKEKEKVARYTASLIRDGDCIFLDAGTTTFQMIPFIEAKEVKVVTNGLTHIEALLEQNIDTYLLGGAIKPKTRALIGQGAIAGLNQYRFDKCFIGVNGVHLDYGYSTPDPEEAMIKKNALYLSQVGYMLCDHSKFHEVTFSKIADLKDAVIVTDADEELIAEFKEETTVKVVTP
ncbi:DeoR/GlpR family DNA-binding transcription regulator [Desertibacillus haloalkaliphilus]|uniref:DeoR/GlpR family DNA-binding transcription regulator n=1 Tax=Desertibacillus haloalkaliphilus TaxID=1328930 RepID=UPI001C270251|nr:DeoR/GlpR family DNA-binding transcription regulator [Desertibacillus haloalkaliphilus]MBU8907902.1 DeoR/GlpR family DNA-binding transcription regulator [Desertibacillus haloalkaliphilus]